jgi:hypothetical protein
MNRSVIGLATVLTVLVFTPRDGSAQPQPGPASGHSAQPNPSHAGSSKTPQGGQPHPGFTPSTGPKGPKGPSIPPGGKRPVGPAKPSVDPSVTTPHKTGPNKDPLATGPHKTGPNKDPLATGPHKTGPNKDPLATGPHKTGPNKDPLATGPHKTGPIKDPLARKDRPPKNRDPLAPTVQKPKPVDTSRFDPKQQKVAQDLQKQNDQAKQVSPRPSGLNSKPQAKPVKSPALAPAAQAQVQAVAAKDPNLANAMSQKQVLPTGAPGALNLNSPPIPNPNAVPASCQPQVQQIQNNVNVNQTTINNVIGNLNVAVQNNNAPAANALAVAALNGINIISVNLAIGSLSNVLVNQGFPPSAVISGAMIPCCAGDCGPVPPYVPGVWIPDNPDDPQGAGVGCGILCNSDGSGASDSEPTTSTASAAAVLGGSAFDLTTLQQTRFLRITNQRADQVKIFVTYEAQTSDGEWAWFPDGDPLAVDVAADQTVDLVDNNWRVNARRVRIWYQSPTGTWDKFKEQDLWLVSEVDDEGTLGYYAPQAQIFDFVIKGPAEGTR